MSSLSDTAAVIASVGVAGLAVFQFLLALGLPYGHAAFGGANSVLPAKLRLASALSSIIFLLAFYVVLARGDAVGGEERYALVTIGIWAFAALFAVSALANVASHSRWERYLMAPIGVVLTVCCAVLAVKP
jgi:hypothetical protein